MFGTFISPLSIAYPGLGRSRHTRLPVIGSRRQTLGHNLLTNLVASYPLNEVSDKRFDHWRQRAGNLTDNNTVTSASNGVGDRAAEFVSANSEYLSAAADGAFQIGNNDYSFCAWVYLANKSASYAVLGHGLSDTSREYFLQYAVGDDRFRFIAYSGSTIVGIRTAASAGSPSATTWYFVCCRFSDSANKVYISVNAGTVDEAATTGDPSTSGSFQLTIGRGHISSGQYWNGRISRVNLWRRFISQDEIAYLYNGGRGRSFPFIS